MLMAIKNQKHTVRSYKCGPDYIDPMFHKSVLGIESKNLDLFFSSKEELQALFWGEEGLQACTRKEGKRDVLVVEGVMGLYDGVSPQNNEGSSYDLACKLDIPILLLVNARGMGRSLLAMLKGFLAMDEQRRIKGIFLNQISPSYYEVIHPIIEEEIQLPVIGYFPRMDKLHIESRYLGLKLPGEIEQLEADLQMAAKCIEKTVDWEKLWALAKATTLEVSAEEVAHKKTVRIGVARDEAFCFYYEENLRLLERLGAEIVEFSPLHDATLPPNIDGLLLGGGYPELYAQELSNNASMLASVKQALLGGMPSLAECGGFLYLHDAIWVEDKRYKMVGAVAGECTKKERLVRFGYVTLAEKTPLFLTTEAQTIKAHEFHYYDSTNNGTDAIATKPDGVRNWEAAHISQNHWWGFAHLYYPSNPAFARAFIDKCATLHLSENGIKCGNGGFNYA